MLLFEIASGTAVSLGPMVQPDKVQPGNMGTSSHAMSPSPPDTSEPYKGLALDYPSSFPHLLLPG